MSALEDPRMEASERWRLHYSHEVVTRPQLVGLGAITYTVAGAVQQDVLSVCFLYDASAAAGSRIPRVTFIDPSSLVIAQVASPFAVAANGNVRFTFAVGIQQFGAAGAAMIGAPIPEIRLQDGLGVQIDALAADAGDVIGDPTFYVRQSRVRD